MLSFVVHVELRCTRRRRRRRRGRCRIPDVQSFSGRRRDSATDGGRRRRGCRATVAQGPRGRCRRGDDGGTATIVVDHAVFPPLSRPSSPLPVSRIVPGRTHPTHWTVQHLLPVPQPAVWWTGAVRRPPARRQVSIVVRNVVLE